MKSVLPLNAYSLTLTYLEECVIDKLNIVEELHRASESNRVVLTIVFTHPNLRNLEITLF